MRLVFPCLLLAAACADSPDELPTATTTQDVAGFEGMFEFAIDLPWRMEPHLVGNHYEYDRVPITIAIHDEDTNTYSGAYGDIGRLIDFCKVEVSRYRDGEVTTTDTYYPRDLEWIELTGRPDPDSTPPRPAYWPMAGLPAPFNGVCHPQLEDCSEFERVRDTSEWHALLYWDPGAVPPGATEILKLTAYVDQLYGCDADPIKLENYARAFWADAPLPRFDNDDRWIYGDLHYHSQSTDNEGESGYAYRAVATAMGAAGIDFVYATDHASDSEQIVDIDALSEGAPDFTPRGLRDLNQARWDWAIDRLHGAGGVNVEMEASWPSDRPRIPRLFLGSEVDVAPELTIAPTTMPDDSAAWWLPYGNRKRVDLGGWVRDGWVTELSPALTLDSIPDLFLKEYDLHGQVEYLPRDTQGFNERHVGRQHVLYIPRYHDLQDAHVPSKSGIFGGGTRRLIEGNADFSQGVLPEIEDKRGIAFLAHPLAASSGGKGPGLLPYTDYQYTKMFDQQALVGLQLWNEDTRVSSADRDFEVSGWDFAGWFDSGTHMDGWNARRYSFVPMWDVKGWTWGRLRFGIEQSLHNGGYTWDKLLRWGLDRGRTDPITWLDNGEPRKLFMAGGSDAHGDWNYRREGYATGITEANDTAIAKVRNLVFAGEPRTPCSALDPKCDGGEPAMVHSQNQVTDALADGKFSVTDGPAVRLIVDRDRDGEISDGDYPMGSVVDLYGHEDLYESLPIIVQWKSTQEFGPVDQVDIYVGSDSDPSGCSLGLCSPDEKRARTYAPIDHGVRRSAWPQDMADRPRENPPDHDDLTYDLAATDCGDDECEMPDGYWLPARGTVRDQMRHPVSGTEGLEGTYPVSINFADFPSRDGTPTRGYVRAFVRTRRSCDALDPATPEAVAYSGECSRRYAFTNPVWALRHAWHQGLPCPFSERSLDRDFDGLPDLCDAAPDSPDNHGWSRMFGGAASDAAAAVAFDPGGNAYVAGSVGAGGGRIERTATTVETYTTTDADALLVKYDVHGAYAPNHLLASGAGTAAFTAVATDSGGFVYVAGQFTGGMQLGSVALSSSDGDAFVAKVRTADFAVQWVYRIGGPGNSRAAGVAVLPSGQVTVVGDFTGSVMVPGTVVSEGSRDCFVLRVSPLGVPQNIQRFGGTGTCEAQAIALDPTSGRSFFAAAYTGALRVGTLTRTSSGRDAVVVRLGSPAELFQPLGTSWIGNPASSADDATIEDLAITSSGAVVAAGYTIGFLAKAIDGGAFTTLAPTHDIDGFLVTIGAGDGNVSLPPVWRFGGLGKDKLSGIATDGAGRILVTGSFSSPSLTTPAGTLTRTASVDGMFFVLGPSLQIAWQRDFGITGSNSGAAASFSVDSRLAIAGTVTQAQVDDTRTLTSAGGTDGFVGVFMTP